MKQTEEPKIEVRTYTWKGEDWVAIWIDGKDVRLPLDRVKATWIARKLGVQVIHGAEARNPAYFAKYGLRTKPPLQKPHPGIIRHPHLRDDGTWSVGPSRRIGPDALIGEDSDDSPSPDEP